MNPIPEQNDSNLEDSVKQVMQTLPLPIRHYLGQGKYSLVAKNLMTKYGLHIDQGTVLEREIMLLLMGIENPDEFANALKTDALISEDVMRSITTDVNQEIFVPLQKQMREGASPVRNQISNGVSAPKSATPVVRQEPIVPPINRAAQIHEVEPRGTTPQVRSAPPPPPPMVVPQMPSQSVQKLASSLHDVIKEVTHSSLEATKGAAATAPLPPKMAMPLWTPENRKPEARKPEGQIYHAPLPQPVPEELPGAMGNAGWPPPPPPTVASGVMPPKYIRTFSGDIKTVEKGGTPDLVPLETGQRGQNKPSSPPPPTPPLSGDPYREPV